MNAKRILLISPQPWEGFRVSKHHYAIELAERGHEVFFLDPPAHEMKSNSIVIEPTMHENVKVVRYRTWFPYRLKFHGRRLFDVGMRIQAKKIVKQIAITPNLIWDFDNVYTFANLNWFGAGLKVLHLVDQTPKGLSSTRHADVVFGVAHQIVDEIETDDTPTYVIGHGLCPVFAEFGKRELNAELSYDPQIRIGYIGNLSGSSIDRPTILQLVRMHPEIKFEFFGPGDSGSFVDALQSHTNCTLHGLTGKPDILKAANRISGWLLCYDYEKDINGGIDSHKVLEYLATGRPVISSRLDAYTDLNLMTMPNEKSNDGFAELFRRFCKLLANDTIETRNRRIGFAIDRTYARRVGCALKLISELNYSVVQE